MGAIKIDHPVQNIDHTIEELARIADKLHLGNDDLGELLHEALKKPTAPQPIGQLSSIFRYRNRNKTK